MNRDLSNFRPRTDYYPNVDGHRGCQSVSRGAGNQRFKKLFSYETVLPMPLLFIDAHVTLFWAHHPIRGR